LSLRIREKALAAVRAEHPIGFGSRLGWREIVVIAAGGGIAQLVIAILFTDPLQLVFQIAALIALIFPVGWLLRREKRNGQQRTLSS
jgi:hypothetical protein